MKLKKISLLIIVILISLFCISDVLAAEIYYNNPSCKDKENTNDCVVSMDCGDGKGCQSYRVFNKAKAEQTSANCVITGAVIYVGDNRKCEKVLNATKDYRVLCPSPLGCQDGFTLNEADKYIIDSTAITNGTCNQPEKGTCPKSQKKYYSCICAAATPKEPSKQVCKEFIVQRTGLPATCAVVKGCDKVKPDEGDCASNPKATGLDNPKKNEEIKYTGINELKLLAKNLNPASITSPYQVAGRLIKLAMQAIGVIVLGFYVWGGVMWMTSSGKSEKIDQAQKIFIWTSMGLIALIGSYVAVDFIFDTLIN